MLLWHRSQVSLPILQFHSCVPEIREFLNDLDSYCLAGIESFSKLGDSIYFEEKGKNPGLYIIQYISSSFDWKSGQIVLNQKVDPVVSSDPYLRITLTFSPKVPATEISDFILFLV